MLGQARGMVVILKSQIVAGGNLERLGLGAINSVGGDSSVGN